MGENVKREPDDSSETCAADEPTAIWDIEALRAAGLEEIIQQQQEPEPARRSPSTAPGPAEPSIVLDEAVLAEDAARAAAEAGNDEAQRNTPSSLPQAGGVDSDSPVAPAPMRIGIESVPSRRYGWGAALGAGAVFFGAVYALIRFLL